MDKIIEKIKNIPNIPHRMEYIYSNGVHIIDDSYNGNIKGVVSAAEVIRQLPGRKVAILQGIVEAGEKTKIMNERVGEIFSSVLDVAVLCGINAKAIENGLNIEKFHGEIIMVNKYKKLKNVIKNIVHSGDVVFFQNDIPDIYS